jgi:nitrite reductase/ring-hydroxylating ferredoxin subunit
MSAPEQDPFAVESTLSRRGALSLGVVTAGAVLTGCGSGGTQTEVDPNAAGLQGVVLAELAAVPVGGAVRVDHLERGPIVVAQLSAGVVAAYSAACTHQQCAVVPDGARLTCPCHGSAFDVSTGAVLNGPAVRPLTKVQVHIAEGRVLTGTA